MGYHTGVLIGSGGMGEVYKAWDPELERFVALKYLHHTRPELVERLLREARAQARIDHPSICKVYEVGADDGRPFIAMQYVEGLPLDEAAQGMTLEQKVLVVWQVAEAVQAAHAAGLIHRDLKPGNVLVAETEDRQLRPYVLDFGIAREREVAGLTVSGQVLGTPGYLSPEQARGEVGALDRRTDVFSLGVILYELLAGSRPFSGNSSVEVLVSLLEQEPVPLRKRAAQVPRELETVVAKCLEKEPQRRYPSARALADDLERFLAGRPVLAQPHGVAYRAGKWVRRNRALTAVTAVAVALVVALAWFGLWERSTARQRARLAQRFGQEAERIGALMRYAHMAPLHDLSAERAFAESQLDRIRDEMERLGDLAEGPGQYALGRGYLAMGRPSAAREHLEAAWAAGFRSPGTAHALGEALGALYLEKLEETQRVRDPQERELRLAEVRAELREPALRFLAAGGEARHLGPEYIQAQLALYEERYDDAIARARQASERHSWLYEARALEGRAHHLKGIRSFWSGEHEEARQEYERARAALRRAAEIGRSDPWNYERLCNNWHLALEVDRAEGAPIEDAFRHVLHTCEQALTADPGLAAAHEKKARAWWRWSEYLLGRGEDPTASLGNLVAAARLAVVADPACFRASNLEGLAWWRRAQYEQSVGADPRESLDLGARALEQALATNPNYRHAHNNLGLIFLQRSRYESDVGADPTRSLERAAEGFRGAIEVDPSYVYAYNNLAIVLTARGRVEAGRGGDPEPFWARAVTAAEGAVERNPKYANALSTLGLAHLRRAELALARGRPAEAMLDEAARRFEAAIAINGEVAAYHVNLAHRHLLVATAAVARGEDPREALADALEATRRALQINPREAAALVNAAEIHLLRAEHRMLGGGDPGRALAEARRFLTDLIAINPKSTSGHLGLALAGWLEARHLASRETDPTPALAQALLAAERAGEGRRTASPLLMTARLERERARWEWSCGRSPTPALGRAAEAVRQALEMAPDDPDVRLEAAELDLARALWEAGSGGDAASRIEAGIARADQALSGRPGHRRSRAVRAALLVARSRLTPEEAGTAEAAARELAEILASDAVLRWELQDDLRHSLANS